MSFIQLGMNSILFLNRRKHPLKGNTSVSINKSSNQNVFNEKYVARLSFCLKLYVVKLYLLESNKQCVTNTNDNIT